MNTPRLETERLILRKFTEEDIEALYALLSDREANTFLPGVPLRSLAETRTFCEERFLRHCGRNWRLSPCDRPGRARRGGGGAQRGPGGAVTSATGSGGRSGAGGL